jgi:DNA-binding CsgD family transcriptional regulator
MVDRLLAQWTLIGASGSHLEAQLMARAAQTAGLDRMIGSCVTTDEVVDLIFSRKERCLLVMVDSIAIDHGEALVGKLQEFPTPPAIMLLLESALWLKPAAYPLDRVDAVLQTQSFGTGVFIKALKCITEGQRYIEPSLLLDLQDNCPPDLPRLTVREQQTLTAMANGFSNREIAQSMGIAESTTREYTRAVLQKLGARNRTLAVRIALERGLIDEGPLF